MSKELFTGGNKKQFEEWYYINEDLELSLLEFYKLDFRLQLGVILAYYDSLGLIVQVDVFDSEDEYYWGILELDMMSPFFKSAECDLLELPKTRNEAYLSAFKEADRIRNKTKKN